MKYITFTVPCYNSQDYMRHCIDNLVAAGEDVEVIIVNDGSKDDTGKIADEYEKKYPTIVKAIQKENGGHGSGVMAGIRNAEGMFFKVVDSDDWMEAGTYKAILKLMDDDDIVEFPVARRLSLSDRSYDNIDDYWLTEQAYAHTFACNKIYRRSLFDDVRYPQGKVFEDVYTLPLLLRKAKRVSTTSQGCYHYEWNPSGITATADGEKLAMLLDAHLTSGMPIDDRYYMYLVNIQMDVCEQTGRPIILPTRQVNTSSLDSKLKIKSILLNVLGISTLCRINKFIHYFKKPNRW